MAPVLQCSLCGPVLSPADWDTENWCKHCALDIPVALSNRLSSVSDSVVSCLLIALIIPVNLWLLIR